MGPDDVKIIKIGKEGEGGDEEAMVETVPLWFDELLKSPLQIC